MAKNSGLRLAAMTPNRCENPVCQVPVEELQSEGKKTWRRTPRKFCSDRCKQERWILMQAAKILIELEPQEWRKILLTIIDHQKIEELNTAI
jgi:hypothetical protein